MNTNSLKRFAVAARTLLMQGVRNRLAAVGFNPDDGSVREEPKQVQNATIFGGEVVDDPHFYQRWTTLRQRLSTHKPKEVIEEAAYTWFNRLMAIRILVHNGLCQPVLDYENPSIRLPRIVTDARSGRIGNLSDADRNALNRVIDDGRKSFDQFAILIRSFCETNPIISSCFGGITDYSALLLPADILAPDNFIDMLNEEDALIADEDWRKPELIGWLYQFYISEKKDEVFAKKGSYDSDEIPAATQIFTPNWIVKYMVENTLGRIYLDNNPGETELQSKWKYLVEPSEPTPDDAILRYNSLEELTCADLSCGSGHILNEMFDLLMQLYDADFYSPREAVETIFRKNLVGVDLDIRARQLAQFALLLKACQTDRAFADAHCLPRVYSMPEVNRYTYIDMIGHFCCAYHLHVSEEAGKELKEAFNLMEQAQTLGSIMIFDISDATREFVANAVAQYESDPQYIDAFSALVDGFRIILALTQKYAAICMNPPYMGSNSMPAELKNYLDRYYTTKSNDLCTVFMAVSENLLCHNGKYGMINQAAWMFKPIYTSFRIELANESKCSFDSILYFGPGIFEELKGERVQSVAFIASKINLAYTIFVHLKSLSNTERIRLLVSKSYKRYIRKLSDFSVFPKFQFGFWVNSTVAQNLKDSSIQVLGDAKQGLKTGSNTTFMRLWFEVSASTIAKKWFLVENGGNFRKWYGNTISVINWENNGYEIKNFKDENGRLRSRPQGLDFAFKKGLTWSTSASERQSFRYSDERVLFESSGSKFCFTKLNNDDNLPVVCAFLNSPVTRNLLEVFSPGLGISEGAVKSLPYINPNDKYNDLARINIFVSKQDWDAHETSWDFANNELLAVDTDTYIDNIKYQAKKHFKESGEQICIDPAAPQLDSLAWRMEQYKLKWEKLFMQLHANEEELNRQFIDIYGLQDELTPDVPLKDITILQQGEINISDSDEITFNADVVIKQFISYAIGCMMGRYRLDRPGLAIAHPDATPDEWAEYTVPASGESWWIDDDGIVPMLGEDCPFHDNAVNRFTEFVRVALGNDSLTDNINFVRQCLGKDIADYLRNDFYADHKRMYQNRPIYWMFSSNQKGKRAAFQCLVYMHRMNRFTPEHIRSNYLLPYIDHLAAREAELQSRPSLSAKENKELKQLTADLAECRDYQLRLHEFADSQIDLDLDDGVVKNYATFSPVLAKLK
jgi:hypothetical protein